MVQAEPLILSLPPRKCFPASPLSSFGLSLYTTWKWEGEQVFGFALGTHAYDLADQRPDVFSRCGKGYWINIHNRPEDLDWAEAKVHWLLEQAGSQFSQSSTHL